MPREDGEHAGFAPSRYVPIDQQQRSHRRAADHRFGEQQRRRPGQPQDTGAVDSGPGPEGVRAQVDGAREGGDREVSGNMVSRVGGVQDSRGTGRVAERGIRRRQWQLQQGEFIVCSGVTEIGANEMPRSLERAKYIFLNGVEKEARVFEKSPARRWRKTVMI